MKDNAGWVKISRSLLNWAWYADVNVKAVMLHLLLTATYKPRHWQGITLQPGQAVTTVAKLSQETGLSVAQTRLAIKKLETSGDITCKTTNKFTIVTIVNSSISEFSKDKNSKQENNEIANEQQTNNKQIANLPYNKKEKNVKKEKDVNHHQEENDDALPSLCKNPDFLDVYQYMRNDSDLAEYLGKMDGRELRTLSQLIDIHGAAHVKDCIDKTADYAPEHFLEYLKTVCEN